MLALAEPLRSPILASPRRESNIARMASGPTDASIRESTVRVDTSDGVALGAILYEPEHVPPCVAAILASGAGLSVVRYKHFCRFLAANGIAVLAYDYRGVGLSRPRKLRGFTATADVWGNTDTAAAIAYVRDRFSYTALASITHSISGVLVGFAPNVSSISRFVFIAPHVGYWRDYSTRMRYPLKLLWQVLTPPIVGVVGYFPGRVLGYGGDIPRGVAMQYARIRSPDFDANLDSDIGREFRRRLASARGYAFAVRASDDPYTSEQGVDRLLGLYSGLVSTRSIIVPSEHGERTIGHFGYFRQARSQDLWPRIASSLLNPPQPLRSNLLGSAHMPIAPASGIEDRNTTK